MRVTGFWENGKKGDSKLEVATLTNVRTSKTIANPDRPGPVGVAPGKAGNREDRIMELETQVEQLMRDSEAAKGKVIKRVRFSGAPCITTGLFS